MSIIHRRSFVQRLGLGIGASLFSPIAQTLVNEARGQVTNRKIWGVYIFSQGLDERLFCPTDVAGRPDPIAEGGKKGPLFQTTQYKFPQAFSGFEKFRNRMLLIDGLAGGNLHGGNDHASGNAALSGVKSSKGSPNGPTIDKLIADRIGKGTPFDALRAGLTKHYGATDDMTFAEGAGRPILNHNRPRAFFDHAFKDFKGQADQLDPNAAARANGGRRLLLDVAREDVKRLRANLAGPEAAKLDKYLHLIGEFETRQSTVTALSCKAPTLKAGPEATGGKNEAPINDDLEATIGMMTVAVACGLTNVFGLTVGTGHTSHGFPYFTAGGQTLGYAGHKDPVPFGIPVMKYVSGLLGQMLDSFASVRVGDKSLFDNMVFTFLSDNATKHHNVGRDRWPVMVIGNAGGALKADGRFMQFGKFSTPLARVHMATAAAVGAMPPRLGDTSEPLMDIL